MVRVLWRRAGRDPLGSDRLASGCQKHHYRQFRGGAIADWSEIAKVPRHMVVGLHGLGANERQFDTLLAQDLPDGSVYVRLRAPVVTAAIPTAGSTSCSMPTRSTTTRGRAGCRLRSDHPQEDSRECRQHHVNGYSRAAPLTVAISAPARRCGQRGARFGRAATRADHSRTWPTGPRLRRQQRPLRRPRLARRADRRLAVSARWADLRHYDRPHVISPAMTDDVSQRIRTH